MNKVPTGKVPTGKGGDFDVQFDSAAFEAALTQLADDLDAATKRAVEAAGVDVEKIFRSLAVVLDGDYRDSWVRLPIEGRDGHYEAAGGPEVPYAGKLERKYGAVGHAYERADIEGALADEWRRAVT